MRYAQLIHHRFFLPGVLVAVIGLYWLTIERPARAQRKTLQAQIEQTNGKLRSQAARQKTEDELQSLVTRNNSRWEEIAAAIPSSDASVLSELSNIARQAKLQVKRLEPLPVQTHAGFQVVPVQLTLATTYAEFVRFLSLLEMHPRAIVVREWEITTGSESTLPTGELQGTLKLEVYESEARREEIAEFADFSGQAEISGKSARRITDFKR